MGNKRIFNVRVGNPDEMLDLMKKLGTMDVDIEAESRPGVVKIVVHGTRKEIQEFGLKLKKVVAPNNINKNTSST